MIPLPKKRHRHVMEPRLIALIDVFSILVIFLIAGTTTDVSTIVLPGGLKLPYGTKGGSISPAPQANLQNGQVTLSGDHEGFSFDLFRGNGSPSLAPLQQKLVTSIEKLRSKDPTAEASLFIVADRSVAYRDLFDVMKFFKAQGYESLILISEAKKVRP